MSHFAAPQQQRQPEVSQISRWRLAGRPLNVYHGASTTAQDHGTPPRASPPKHLDMPTTPVANARTASAPRLVVLPALALIGGICAGIAWWVATTMDGAVATGLLAAVLVLLPVVACILVLLHRERALRQAQAALARSAGPARWSCAPAAAPRRRPQAHSRSIDEEWSLRDRPPSVRCSL